MDIPIAQRSAPHILSSLCQALLAQAGSPIPPLGPQDWAATVRLAQAERVAPLLYWSCQQAGWPAGIPAEARQELTRQYFATAARNTLLFDELERILAALAEAAIPVIVLKGAALATTLYPSIGLRPMADLDLLVPQADMERALQIAKEQLGYREPRMDEAPHLNRLVDYHVHLVSGAAQPLVLELHWNLVASRASWYAAPVEWFWQHSQPLPAAPQARMLAPEAQLLYLAAHAVLQHGASETRLLWIYDIHALAGQPGLDWDGLLEQARALRWSAVLLQALKQAQACFATPLPGGLLERLEAQSEARLARVVALKTKFPPVRLLYNWYTLAALNGPARLRFIGALLFPSQAYIAWRYRPHPAWTWPLYYPYRWAIMIWESLLTLGHGLKRLITS